MRARHLTLARRYARAMLDVSEDAVAAREALRRACELLRANAELRSTLTHPAVSPDRKKAIVDAVWSDPQPQLLRRLLRLLAERGRLGILEDIAREFSRQLNQKRGVVEAEVVSAVPLGERQVASMAEGVRQRVGKEVELSADVDPDLIGGLLVRVGGTTLDGSVRTQLRALKRSLRQDGSGG